MKYILFKRMKSAYEDLLNLEEELSQGDPRARLSSKDIKTFYLNEELLRFSRLTYVKFQNEFLLSLEVGDILYDNNGGKVEFVEYNPEKRTIVLMDFEHGNRIARFSDWINCVEEIEEQELNILSKGN